MTKLRHGALCCMSEYRQSRPVAILFLSDQRIIYLKRFDGITQSMAVSAASTTTVTPLKNA